MKLRAWLWIAVVALVSHPCLGWGREGHTISGAIAWHFMTEKAKAAIDQVLGDRSARTHHVSPVAWSVAPNSHPSRHWGLCETPQP
ncbi:MAG: hypothetical protein L0Y42_10225 [Phycisphaerales bacterium]|nr:hypothetical protein [Phycisphaerales bacterium]